MFSLKQLNVNSVLDRSALEPSSERVNGASFSSVPIDATEEKDIPLDDDDDHVEPQYEEEKLQVCLITFKNWTPKIMFINVGRPLATGITTLRQHNRLGSTGPKNDFISCVTKQQCNHGRRRTQRVGFRR